MRPAPRLSPTLLATVTLLAWGLAPGGPARPGTPAAVREALRNDLPNPADYERIERGYYEQLLDASRRFDLHADDPNPNPNPEHGHLTYRVPDVREYALRPNMDHDPGRRIPWTTNADGMRDRAYARAKPPGTYRVALAGDSIAAGWGVGDSEGFEPRLERALDARSRASGGPAVEVLNFAVPGHGPGQRWDHFSRTAWGFGPDLVLFEATPADAGWDERRLRGLLARGVGFDAPVYRDVLRAAGVRPGLDEAVYRAALKPYRKAILEGVYLAAAADCRARGVPVVLVLVPRVGKAIEPSERSGMLVLARAAGFTAAIDACDAYDGADPRDLAVGPSDFHPNAEGHARIAGRILDALADRPELARLWQGDRAAPAFDPEIRRASDGGGGAPGGSDHLDDTHGTEPR